jgi:hypothetical protein
MVKESWRELKGLILLLNRWVIASAEFAFASKPHEYWSSRHRTGHFHHLQKANVG